MTFILRYKYMFNSFIQQIRIFEIHRRIFWERITSSHPQRCAPSPIKHKERTKAAAAQSVGTQQLREHKGEGKPMVELSGIEPLTSSLRIVNGSFNSLSYVTGLAPIRPDTRLGWLTGFL
jgi:hypothetical protein